MTLKVYNLDAGGEGTTVTTGNSGATTVSLSGGTAVYAAASALSGPFGITLTNASAASAITRWAPDAGDGNPLIYAFEVMYGRAAQPSANGLVIQGRSTGSPTGHWDIYWNTTGIVQLRDSGGTVLGTLIASSTPGVKYRWAGTVNMTTGAYSISVYSGTSTTPLTTLSGTMTTTANGLATIQVGAFANTTATAQMIDYIAINGGATSLIGPPSNAAPTVSLTGNQTVAPSATVTCAATAADTDGSVVSYAWTVTRYTTTAAPATITPTKVGGAAIDSTTATIQWTASSATAGVLDVITCVVTDDVGATSGTARTEVRVPTSGVGKPLSGYDSLTASWTLIGGGASVGASLNDGSATTRVESPDFSGTATVQEVRLAPMTGRTALRTTITDAVLTTSGTNTNKVRIKTGATQVTERATSTLKKTSDNSTSDVTTSDLSLYFDLTGPEVAATDFNDVRVAVVTAS